MSDTVDVDALVPAVLAYRAAKAACRDAAAARDAAIKATEEAYTAHGKAQAEVWRLGEVVDQISGGV